MDDKKNTFSTATWILLLVGAGIIDGIQVILDVFVLGVILNYIIDFITALTLVSIFVLGGVRDKKVLLSVLGGLGLGFFSAGILPAWIADVGFAWLVTDGKKTIGKAPVVGKMANKAIEVSRMKSGKIPKKKYLN